MSKRIIILILFLGIILFSQCKKDEESWTYCVDCELNSWVGNYEGTGDYYSDSDGQTIMDVPTTVIIENTSGTILFTKVTAEELFYTTFTIDKTDNEYIIEQPGSSRSLSLTLSEKGSEYKLSGTARLYHQQSDTLFIDHSISFDVFKSK